MLFEGHSAVLHAVSVAFGAWVRVGDSGDDGAAGEAFIGICVGWSGSDVEHCVW